ncbi:MAG: tRNA 2-thiocytidine biosynthesis protein TtcA [Prevotella sp.]|nr:tRNA 2-thiocytidine biosynthesis protein TtcA [Prevotella sp.]
MKKGTRDMEKNKVTRLFNEALQRYGLIADGDRVLIGLSGGKDSMALLELLALRSRIFVPRFEVEAAFVRMNDIPYQSDEDYLKAFAASHGVTLHVVETSSLDARESREKHVAGIPTDGEQKKPVCFQCSWQRRKKLFETAKELGCNKIALGHHRDDLMETALMNLTFQGQFSTMRPMMPMDRFPMTIIRPLCLIREREMEQWAASHGYKKQIKNCPFESASKRFNMKQVVAELEQMNPEFAYTFYRAIERTF